MNQARKLSHAESPLTKLKTQWRNLFTDEDRDYWRTQFESERTRLQLREELQQKHGLWLTHDMQLRRFCQWVADEDLRAETAEEALSDRAELESQGLAEQDLRPELLRRMKERALARGDFKLAAEALKLDLKAERVALETERVALQARKVGIKERQEEVAKQPGGLTPEVLEKIERELNLFGPIVHRGQKSAVKDPDEPVAQTSESAISPTCSRQAPISDEHVNDTRPVPSPLELVASKRSEDGGERARVRGARTLKGAKSEGRKTDSQNPTQTPIPQPNPQPDIALATHPKPEASHAPTSPSDEWDARFNMPLDPVQDNHPVNPVILSKSRFQPALDPMLEACNTLDLMNRKIIPYDAAELKRLYAKLPPGILRTTKY